MSLHLFSRGRSCHELGVCQRTGTACRRACHQANTDDSAGPAIGYEAAPATNVHLLRPEYEAALRAEKIARGTPPGEEEQDRPAGPWAALCRARTVVTAVLLLLSLLAAVWLMAANPQATLANLQLALAQAGELARALYWAAMNVSS